MLRRLSPRRREPTDRRSPARTSVEAATVIGPTILHSNKRSSCSWRVRIALNLKRIPYDIEPISLENYGDDQPSDEFLKINPMQHVPALRIDNHTLIGSLNILLYLEETRPRYPLMPVDPIQRARVREICDVIGSGIQPLQYVIVLDYVGEQRKLEWAEHWISRGFNVEKLLSSRTGLYCVGDDITLADCCLVPQMYNARRYGVDLKPFPNMVRVDRNLQDLPAFASAHPNNHPDSPSEAVRMLLV